MNKKKILVVEDDNDLRVLLADKLDRMGFLPLQAEDGEAALPKIMDEHPDLILLDLMLPKLDGFGVLERVRSYPDQKIANIPVIILSNLWSNKDILRARALKIDEYYVKAQTDLQEVFNKVTAVLEGKKTQ